MFSWLKWIWSYLRGELVVKINHYPLSEDVKKSLVASVMMDQPEQLMTQIQTLPEPIKDDLIKSFYGHHFCFNTPDKKFYEKTYFVPSAENTTDLEDMGGSMWRILLSNVSHLPISEAGGYGGLAPQGGYGGLAPQGVMGGLPPRGVMGGSPPRGTRPTISPRIFINSNP